MRRIFLLFIFIIVATISIVFINYLSALYYVENEKKVIVDTGTIKFLSFEGRFYGIVSDNGRFYDPVDLKKEYEVDGLWVYFEAKILDLSTIHMWGKPVTILKIQNL